MKLRNIPDDAFTASTTTVPMKMQVDWAALFAMLVDKGHLVLYYPEESLRETKQGGVECPLVKGLVSYAFSQKRRVHSKRITTTRWYCTLVEEQA